MEIDDDDDGPLNSPARPAPVRASNNAVENNFWSFDASVTRLENSALHQGRFSSVTTTTPSYDGCLFATLAPRRRPSLADPADDADHSGTMKEYLHAAGKNPNEDEEEEDGDDAAAPTHVRGQRGVPGDLTLDIPQLDGVNDGRKHGQHAAGSSSSYQVRNGSRWTVRPGRS